MWKEDTQLTTALAEHRTRVIESPARAPANKSAGVPAVEVHRPLPPSPSYVCETCGGRARVQILAGYLAGKPVMRHFCIACAHATPLNGSGGASAKARVHLANLVGMAGCLLASLFVLSEWLIPPQIGAGFGWHKEAGVALGALLVILGTLMRGDLIMLGGMFVFAISIIAGLYGLTQTPGLGWKDQALLVVALLCVLLSLVAGVARRRTPAVAPERSPAPSNGRSEPAAGI